MFEELLQPIAIQIPESGELIGANTLVYSDEFPDWNSCHLAIVGVHHGADAQACLAFYNGLLDVRQELYKLSKNNQNIRLVDLGNIRRGASPSDTAFALQTICTSLTEESIIPIILGGDESFTFAHYRSFESITRNLEYCAVAPKFNLRGDSAIARICTHEPNYLFNFTVLGYQSHYVDDHSISAFKKMYFQPIRLGLLRNRLNEIEPVLRNTDLCTIDLDVLKASDHPGSKIANPNGLSSEEICQIAWYSGISEKMRSFGVYSFAPEWDERNRSALLTAQIIWYFIDGFYNRKGDHPDLHNEFYLYRCALNSKQPDILFYKSKRTDRWWMKIPNPRSLGNKENNILIPCTYADYQTATKGEMPERFWQALQKI
jgi:arginase family enzyme